MDRATFAAERGARLDDNDGELRPIVEKALKNWSAKGDWYEDIVTASSVLWRELFEKSSGAAVADDEDALMAQFQAEMRDTLAHTGDPADAAANQAQTITFWASTYTANNAEIRAQRFNGHPNLEWVTKHDSHVRELHVPMDGKQVPSGQMFDLGGGVHLAYPGQPTGPLEYWINCRCLVRSVQKELKMTDQTLIAAPVHTDLAAGTAEPEDLVDMPSMVPFHGVAAPTDAPSGDGRQLAKAGFAVRNLPLPLNYLRGSDHGGDPGPAVTVGRVDAVWLDDATGLVHYAGQFVPSIPESGEAIQHIVDGTMTGVSVDADNGEMMMASDPNFVDGLAVFTGWRVAGITMCAIPAFQEANIALGPHPDLAEAPVTAAGLVDTHDGPGWIPQPVPTQRLRSYWTTGEGRAKLAWGVPGDFDRCRAHLGKYVEPQYLAGTCANLHYVATGAWPGHAPGESIRASLVAAGAKMARAVNIVLPEPEEPVPSEFFNNPQLTGPTPFTVDEETGHVFGHVATWGTCHIGYSGVCTTAPESFTNYAYFRTGAVATDRGEVPVGHITMDGGHAPVSMGAKPAAAHYDNTTSVVADVAAGEDAYGIWVSGLVRSGLTLDKMKALKAAALSGDWRSIGGHLEMVAALAVNVPGFPIPRTSLAASGEHQESLIAAGIVTKETAVMAEMPPMPPKAPMPPMPPKAEKPPVDETKKPHVPGDEAVKSAIDTLQKGLHSLGANPSPEAVQSLITTVDDLAKYLGLEENAEAKEETAEGEAPDMAAVVASIVRREMAIAPRRDAAKQVLRNARIARAKRLVR